ncbi:MAG: hypothetical protein PHX43_02445 [Alphaproteobacteria bacterium]|nr:hypothetical protein [Alphaproteobacteria bacterium]
MFSLRATFVSLIAVGLLFPAFVSYAAVSNDVNEQVVSGSVVTDQHAGLQLKHGTSNVIVKIIPGECRILSNGGSEDYFVPAKTHEEWNSFLNHLPPGVTSALCPGVCGAANGTTVYALTATDLCSVGTASSVAGAGPWSWTCGGNGDGFSPSPLCTASLRTDGVCGAANGITVADTTALTTAGLCNVGASSSIAGVGPWSWTCVGNGGTVPACSASKTVAASSNSEASSGTSGASGCNEDGCWDGNGGYIPNNASNPNYLSAWCNYNPSDESCGGNNSEIGYSPP